MNCLLFHVPADVCVCELINTYKKHTVGFKNIYDTLKQYFVYRTAAVEAASGAALEPTFTVLETLEETLHDELKETRV